MSINNNVESLELEPTTINLLHSFNQDAVGRNQDLMHFIRLLDSYKKNTIAIDSSWGNGKTFFVKQAKLLLDFICGTETLKFNDYYKKAVGIPNEDKLLEEFTEKINKEWNKAFNTEKFEITSVTKLNNRIASVYYDAWSSDNDEDPILSLVFTILHDLQSYYDLSSWNINLEPLINGITECFLPGSGVFVGSFFGLVKYKDCLQALKDAKSLQERIKELFAKLLSSKNANKFVIFIDELDRCKPDFALKLLERIKHYFCLENVVFVFSTNINQLQEIVKTYYGNSFEACRYLNRFFDFTVSLPKIDINSYCNNQSELLGSREQQETINVVCKAISESLNMSIREFDKFYYVTNISLWNYISKNFTQYQITDKNGRQFCFIFVIPCIIALKIVNQEDYEKFISGKGQEIFYRLLYRLGKGPLLIYFGNKSQNTDLKNTLNNAYLDLYHPEIGINLPGMYFTKDLKDEVFRVANLLTNDAEFIKR